MARSPRHDQRGSAAIEFALVLPLLLVITLGLVQVGLLVRDRLLVESAARAGARAAALSADAASIHDAVVGAAPDLDPSAISIGVTRSGAQGDPVTVDIGYQETIRVPFVDWLFASGVSMHAVATDRQEFS